MIAIIGYNNNIIPMCNVHTNINPLYAVIRRSRKRPKTKLILILIVMKVIVTFLWFPWHERVKSLASSSCYCSLLFVCKYEVGEMNNELVYKQ